MSLYYVLCQLCFIVSFAQNGPLSRERLILFLALGFLLIFVLVALIAYLILKFSSKDRVKDQESGSIKSQVDKGKKTSVDALPNGTTLLDGLYVVEEYMDTSDNIRIYRIKRTQPLYLCSHCNSELANDTNAFCRVCGAALGVIPPTYPSYILKESEAVNTFSTEERLIGMNLNHPSLILPVESFRDSPLDSPRHYLVEPCDQEPTLSGLQLPMPANDVLDIGVNLAEGLAYLHNYSVVLKHLDLDSVVYLNNEAKWQCYRNVHLVSSEEEVEYKKQYSVNVSELTGILKKLLIGDTDPTSTIQIPEVLQELIIHYGNAAENITVVDLARSLRHANRMLGGHNQARYDVGAKSDVGRLRKLNEDSMVIRELSPLFQGMGVTIVVGGVADGVGGQAAGDVASQLTVASLETHLDDLQEEARMGRIPEAQEWLIKSANNANENVYKERTQAGNNMACTLVLAFFTGDLATILNVGDSRAYLLNERGIRQITTDHSLVERLVSIGQLSREEARHHPRKSVIYRVIGDRLNLDYDIFTQTFVPGEALLMCSDGLSDMVEDATIWRIWRAASSPQAAVEQLVDEANAAGGTDNITVIIVEIFV